jgi:hypothetical protein
LASSHEIGLIGSPLPTGEVSPYEGFEDRDNATSATSGRGCSVEIGAGCGEVGDEVCPR